MAKTALCLTRLVLTHDSALLTFPPVLPPHVGFMDSAARDMEVSGYAARPARGGFDVGCAF